MAPNVRSLCKSIGLNKTKTTIASAVDSADFYSSQRAYDKRQQQKEEIKQTQRQAATEQRQTAEMRRKWRNAFFGEDHNQVMVLTPESRQTPKEHKNNNKSSSSSFENTVTSSSSLTAVTVAAVVTPAGQETREEEEEEEEDNDEQVEVNEVEQEEVCVKVYEGRVSHHGNENSGNNSLLNAALARPPRPLSPEQQLRVAVEVQQRALAEYRTKWREASSLVEKFEADANQLDYELSQFELKQGPAFEAATAQLADAQVRCEKAKQDKQDLDKAIRALSAALAGDLARTTASVVSQASAEEEEEKQKKQQRRKMMKKPWTAFKAWVERRRNNQ